MTDTCTTTNAREREQQRPDDDDLCHIACCRDDTLALCGQGLTCDAAPGEPASCVVCTDIETSAPFWCPKFTDCPEEIE